MEDNEALPLLQFESGWREGEAGVVRRVEYPDSRPASSNCLVGEAQRRCLEKMRCSTQSPRSSLPSFSPSFTSHANPSPSQNTPQVLSFHRETEGIISHTILEPISERSSPVSTMSSVRLIESPSNEDEISLAASESTSHPLSAPTHPSLI